MCEETTVDIQACYPKAWISIPVVTEHINHTEFLTRGKYVCIWKCWSQIQDCRFVLTLTAAVDWAGLCSPWVKTGRHQAGPFPSILPGFQSQDYAAVCCAHLRPTCNTSGSPAGLCSHMSPLAGARPVQGRDLQHLLCHCHHETPPWCPSQPAKSGSRVGDNNFFKLIFKKFNKSSNASLPTCCGF